MIPFKLISDWQNKNLKCFNCGEYRSVKYEMDSDHYCNACIMIVANKKYPIAR